MTASDLRLHMTQEEKYAYFSKIWEEYAFNISDINNFKHATKNLTEIGLKHYFEQKEIANKVHTNTANAHNTSFYRLDTGVIAFLGYQNNTYDDIIHLINRQHNNQYKWMLVEAYEYFEDLIEKYFELLAYIEHNILKDKEKAILLEDGDILSFEDFRTQLAKVIKQTKDLRDPEKILNRIRNHIPNIIDIETNNKIGKHVRFEITMISKFRHIIVHERGMIKDYELFKTRVFKDAGLALDSKDGQLLLEIFNSYIYEDGTIAMHEHYFKRDGIPLQFTNDRLMTQIQLISAYAWHIAQQILKKI